MADVLELPRLEFTKTTLSNGLDVIARRQGELPIVAVNLWYHVGSKNEERRQRGFAHLFEHLMFEGSEHYPGDYFRPLQRVGAKVNGSTSSDRTNYFVDLPTAHLELAVAMESDRMGFLLPALTEEKLRVQKDVVTNEYRQNYANRPYGQVYRILAEALYPPSHPYSWLTIGAMEDVEAATKADVEAFFRRFYVPGNASLAIVGAIDPDEAIGLAERYFGSLPGGTAALPLSEEPAGLKEDLPIRLYENVELDRLYLVWPSVRQFDADDAPLSLAADLLTRGKSGRLYRRLVLESGLAQDVSASQWSRELAGSFSVTVTLRPGRSWEEARDVVDSELEALRREIRPEELNRVRMGRMAAFLYALDDVGGFGGVADRLNAYNVFLGDPSRVTTDFERFRSVEVADIQQALGRHVLGEGGARRPRVELVVLGRSHARPLPAVDRKVRPEPSTRGGFRPPLPEVRQLRCGSPLWVIPRRELPMVVGTMVLKAGAGVHGPDQGGLAQLTASMLDEGTTTRTLNQIAEQSESMGTKVWSSSGWDGSYLGWQCLSPFLEPTLDLVVDIALRPSFPEAEWRRVRGQTLASLRADADQADVRAYRGLIRHLYREGHPYRVALKGELGTIEALGLDDLRAFHARWYRPEVAAWVVAGDVDPDQMAAWLDERLGDWASMGVAGEPGVADVERGTGRSIRVLHRAGAPQAVVTVGHVGIERLDPEHDDLMVLNHILGGDFVSRLNTKLREEKGFTYGIRSHFDARRGPGPFSVQASIQADKVAEAVSDIVREIEEILGDRPPTEAELDSARRSLLEGQAMHFETPAALVSRYGGLFLYGLPLETHQKLPERLGGVTRESMARAAGKALRPFGLSIVVAADADQVVPGLEALGWSRVEVVRES